MKRNMGTVDRLIRTLVIAPVALLVAAWAGFGTAAGIVGVAVATIMLATSAVGFCPLYALFGIGTCRRKAPGRA